MHISRLLLREAALRQKCSSTALDRRHAIISRSAPRASDSLRRPLSSSRLRRSTRTFSTACRG
ncbi:uncharacterized protein MYCGRDRAFT_106637 [Zymoseptoria tritici IPO323]|uniref:Uncharacterized protein n=1 Tax=Zymoseptoria tritici (strain CBS 115943 / IPO323) TaxID=336722 RepID=F9XRB3_ZYMTI|nr:uncharacterized protein MYCGRDRAFT_106637 [Zymoseptoria tritici IPO323]EGP82225.1 hypothetical protein MYCGRDRAFT_106637 [Zymoseptoria tritici IPO323]